MSRARPAVFLFIAAVVAACSAGPTASPVVSQAAIATVAQSVAPTPTEAPTPTATPSVDHQLSELQDLDGFHEFPVGGDPDWQAISDDAVWVGNDSIQQIHRIDGASGELTSLDVGFGPCNGLAVGFDALWSADCFGQRLNRIGLQSQTVEGSVDTYFASGGEGLTAAGEGYVWLIGEPGQLVAVDPASMQIAATIAVSSTATSVAVGFGSAWVADPGGGTVSRVDPATMAVIATVDVGGAPRFLVAGEGAVWALNQVDGTVARIDPDSNQVAATIAADSPGEGGCIATGAGSVWTTTFDHPVTRIDATTNEVLLQFSGGQGGDCIDVGFGSVWLSNLRTGTIWQLPLDGLDALAGGS